MEFQLNEKELFQKGGVQITAFSDFYPAGRQSGISVIMHGHRVASNGDVRFEPTPGQWQPVPKKLERNIDPKSQTVITTLAYPDVDAHLKGFNPIIYPDFEFTYQVSAKADGDAVLVTVDLDRAIPEKYLGKLCFNLEFYPGDLFGKTWIMDDQQGIFPRQPNGPTISRESNFKNAGHFEGVEEGVTVKELVGMQDHEEMPRGYQPALADDVIAKPYAEGHAFTACPEDPYRRMTIESKDVLLKLYDGRMNHNNGWFAVSSELPAGKAKGALTWRIRPNAVEGWKYPPVVQTSQVGYHPEQAKIAVIETDPAETFGADTDTQAEGSDLDSCAEGALLNSRLPEAKLWKITAEGERESLCGNVELWGDFLRYRYYRFDFSKVKEPGLYFAEFRGARSAIFRIGKDVYDRGVWQPVLEYFLPVQMCHMEVREKYRLWHGHCHADDARMAPVSRNHFDGYRQGPATLTRFQPGAVVPGLNVGGWHDAGDFDLRVESQSGECYILALAYEAFGTYYDCSTIDQRVHLVEIHQPDGKNDVLEQIEHGALSVVGGYKALGRLYRGIICKELRQYVLLGDPAGMTRGIQGDEDDRLVFTEENPWRELSTAAHLAATSRVMKDFNNTLSKEALRAATELFLSSETGRKMVEGKVSVQEKGVFSKGMICTGLQAAAELFLTTGDEIFLEALRENQEYFFEFAAEIGWVGARIADRINEEGFTERLRESLLSVKEKLEKDCESSPYGVPYRSMVYGAGWGLQGMAFRYYFLHKAFSDLFGKEFLENVLNFVLGCHPGSNTASFASGVGAKSMTTAYGLNRADWSYVPGGVVSGTALIQPDLPELLDYPFLWQQAEYVMGGGSSNYLFLVLAVIDAQKQTAKS
ncbi:MAG: glycoside hydrolase family 9 protein [Acetatifactor sp.]|nr:glycoside hydrolase family 9 protein [Acetatifactor sp.]